MLFQNTLGTSGAFSKGGKIRSHPGAVQIRKTELVMVAQLYSRDNATSFAVTAYQLCKILTDTVHGLLGNSFGLVFRSTVNRKFPKILNFCLATQAPIIRPLDIVCK